jgi:hypothetical protein
MINSTNKIVYYPRGGRNEGGGYLWGGRGGSLYINIYIPPEGKEGKKGTLL